MAGGDTYTIIYLKMQLKALKTDGVLTFTGVEEDFADELALDLDERSDDVRVTLMFLLQYGLCECSDNIHYVLPWVAENTGSETASTQRSRECRKRKALQCNTDATEVQRICNVEKEIEIEKELDIEDKRKRFIPPTLDEIKAYCKEKGYTRTNPEAFFAHYDSIGWKVGKNPMKKWKSALTGWELREGDRWRSKKPNLATNYKQSEIKKEDWERMVIQLDEQ